MRIPSHAPEVSLGLPLPNGERFLARAMGSRGAQSFEDLELIISDNRSTDGIAEISRELQHKDSRIRYAQALT